MRNLTFEVLQKSLFTQ